MHQSGSVSLCRSAISVLVATALYSPIALASTVEYGETVDGVVLEKDIQLVYGTANNTKINPGGEQHIKEFGISSNTEINGGYQYIEMNGTAEYSVLNDGYQIVQMGGAANQTTLNNGVLQVYGAANEPTIKGGRLIIEKDGITVFAAIEKGGLLEVKEGGLAFAVDQKAGGAIKTTTGPWRYSEQTVSVSSISRMVLLIICCWKTAEVCELKKMTSLIIPLWIVAAYWRLWMAGLQLALIKKQAEN